MQLAANNFLILTVLVFIAVMLALEGLYLLWRSTKGPEAKKLHKRLQSLSAAHDVTAQTQLLKQRMLNELPPWERFVMRLPRVSQLDRFLLQSGLSWTASRLLLTTAVLGLAGSLTASVLLRQPFFTSLLAGVAVALIPVGYVAWMRNRRIRKLEQQLPDALDLIGRGLRAGHAFTSALKMAGEELPHPIAGEFRTVHDEINFGVSMERALTNLAERVPSTDVRYFVVAVLIQRESGGNLTEILGNLSRLVRERLKLMARVRVLSSEGRLSAWILILMPFFIAGIMNLVNPTFMSPLWTDPIGIAIVKTLLIMMAMGALLLRKLSHIRV